MLSVRGDTICLLDVQSRVRVYSIAADMQIVKCAEIRCHDLVPHAACVIDLLLTNMHHHSNRVDVGRE